MLPFIIDWRAPENDLIASSQTFEADVPLNLKPHQDLIIDFQYRPISITSPDNVSTIDFTITGRLPNGKNASETIAGPLAGLTVYTTNFFKDIISVIPNTTGFLKTVSIGIGAGGISDLLSQQYIQIGSAPYTVGVQVTGAIEYSVSATIQPIYTILKGPQAMLVNNYENLVFYALNSTWEDATTSQEDNFTDYPSMAIRLTADTNAANTGSLQLTYLSGGI